MWDWLSNLAYHLFIGKVTKRVNAMNQDVKEIMNKTFQKENFTKRFNPKNSSRSTKNSAKEDHTQSDPGPPRSTIAKVNQKKDESEPLSTKALRLADSLYLNIKRKDKKPIHVENDSNASDVINVPIGKADLERTPPSKLVPSGRRKGQLSKKSALAQEKKVQIPQNRLHREPAFRMKDT
ncbi:unnamed protein product [Auanema sp. JU1783]|nr:unnamed protein product [Auanema sp. JU1783]